MRRADAAVVPTFGRCPRLSSSAGNTVGQANRGTLDTSHNGELVLSTRLVTMEEIGDRLGGIRRVVVASAGGGYPGGARRIAATKHRSHPRFAGEKRLCRALRLVVVAARTKFDPKPLAKYIAKRRHRGPMPATDCILAATDQLAGELAKGDALGLLLDAAYCRRAVFGQPACRACEPCWDAMPHSEADVGAVGANLLVADPQSVSLFKLCRMAGDFYRGGMRPCPEVFRKRLT